MEIKTLDDFRQWTLNQEWTFAKTMSYNPHEWTTKVGYSRNFPSAVEFIYAHGKKYKFGYIIYVCLDCDDYYYWTCTYPDEDGNYTQPESDREHLMNRALIVNRKAYPYKEKEQEPQRKLF